MKVYPVNEDQLAQLGTLRGLAGVCFTLAGAAVGFAANIYKDLQMQTQVSADVLAYWGAIRDVSFIVSIVLAGLGVIFWGKSKYRLYQIMKSTKFND